MTILYPFYQHKWCIAGENLTFNRFYQVHTFDLNQLFRNSMMDRDKEEEEQTISSFSHAFAVTGDIRMKIRIIAILIIVVVQLLLLRSRVKKNIDNHKRQSDENFSSYLTNKRNNTFFTCHRPTNNNKKNKANAISIWIRRAISYH